MKKILSTLLLTSCASFSQAELHPALEGVYMGGGISHNNIDLNSILDTGDNETAAGFQVFAGKDLPNSIDGFETAVEVSVSKTNDFNFGFKKKKVTGLMASAVIMRDLDEVAANLYAIAKFGVDVGDDDGMFMGIGAGYRLNSKIDLRAEYLNKDIITSFQLNASYNF